MRRSIETTTSRFCISDIADVADFSTEEAPIEDLYYDPKHPYTVGLMSSIPRLGQARDRLQTIPGTMPDLVDVPPGCSFHPRCPYAEERCTQKEPPLVDTATGAEHDADDVESHAAACLAYTGDLLGELDFDVRIDESDEPGAATPYAEENE
jgi:peptide/nickel transport system ATP-binding protein